VLPFIALKSLGIAIPCSVFCGLDLTPQARFKENPMPERVNSLASKILGAVFISLAAVNFDSPVRADDACIEQPPQPVAEGMHGSAPYASCHSCHAGTAEDPHWSARYDRARGRRCWFLLDADGRDVTAHARARAAPAPTLSSTLASVLGNFNLMGASADVTPKSNAPKVSPPSPQRKQGDTAGANKTDNRVRAAQRSSDDGHAAKQASRESNQQDHDRLFEEFLEWNERQNVINNTLGPRPSTR
jgi:hypothetical protein